MKNNVMIKPIFGEWREVDEQEAKRYAHLLYNHIKNVSKYEDKIQIVQSCIKGIKVEELLGEERWNIK